MKRTLPLLLVLSLPAWLAGFAGEDAVRSRFSPACVDAVMDTAAAITPESFPDADAVMVDNRITVRYEPDGTARMIEESFVKVLTERGRRTYRTRGLPHTIPYDEVEIISASIIRPDRTRLPVDPARYARDMAEPSQMLSNIYNPNRRVLRLTFPGVEVGDLLQLRVMDSTVKPRVPDSWAGYMVLEYDMPIVRLDYSVDAPDELPLQHRVLRDEIAGTVAYESSSPRPGRTLHNWRVTDVPRMFPEPDMPPRHTQVQRLLLSTSPDWQHISRWYWELSRPRLEAVSEEMRNKVAALSADNPDRETLIGRLFSYVAGNIRYMGITTETEAPGYEPRDVGVTFRNRYGVCRDKAAVLVAMLRLAGLPAYPVLIHTRARKDPEVPQPYFNHAIVAVANGDGTYQLMDPTDETIREPMPAFLGNRSYLVARPEGEALRLSPVAPAENNLVRIETSARLLDDQTLELDGRICFEGINDQVYRTFFARQAPEVRRRFAEGVVSSRWAGAELTDFHLEPEDPADTAHPLSISLRARIADYPVFEEAGEQGVIVLPRLAEALGYVNFVIESTGLRRRRFPLETRLACGVKETISLDLSGSGLLLGEPPPDVDLVIDGASFSQAYSLKSPVAIRSRSSFSVEKPEFDPDEYDRLKSFLAGIEHSLRKTLLVRRDLASPDDSRLLNHEILVRLESPSWWVETHDFQREILTFAGLRRYSEIKVPYNSGWEQVELTGATVINRDGSVHTVAGHEINHMDQGWVGGAPRYPGSRTMVVNLPGVEIGSIINASIRITRQGAPFFHLQRGFRKSSPVQESRLTVEVPATISLNKQVHLAEMLDYAKENEDGLLRHHWRAGPLPRLETEDRMPPQWFLGPAVFISSATAGSYAETVYGKIERAALHDGLPGDLVDRLAPETATTKEKIRNIRDFVIGNIRAAGINFTDLPLSSLSPAGQTLADGYGHGADRAILLLALLRAAGVEATPLLVAGDASLVGELRRPWEKTAFYGFFNRVLVRVEDNGSIYFLNDTNQYAPLPVSASDRLPTLERDGSFGMIDLPPEMREAKHTEWRMKLADNGDVQATRTVTYHGLPVANFRRRYAEMTPEIRDRHHQEMVGRLSHAATAEDGLITKLDAYPGIERFTARLPGYAADDGEHLVLRLPEANQGLAGRGDRRRNPFLQPQYLRQTTTWTVQLPQATAQVVLSPRPTAWSLPDGMGTVEVTSELATEDGEQVLRVWRRIMLEPGLLPAERYREWRLAHRTLLHPSTGLVKIRLAPDLDS